ncbi:WD repeat-containing protein 81 [Agrilus planipennis]|uniref:WD repeat-containing protein 81 n=1 Tax=Agrilus planipennis TaxID=224129 RepID=A0A7F5RKD7_AGRPL|nr:WD repeat-containing protein 81 [Agrilus planipennis]
MQNLDSRNESETSLNDDSSPQAAAKVSPLAISRLLSRSRSSLSEDQRDNNKLSRSPSAQRSASVGPKSSSPALKLSSTSHLSVPKASLNDGVIYLPKEYNPALALTSIEQFHSFLSKTFHEEQYKHLEENFSAFSLQEGREDVRSDRSVDDSVIQNAFTNRYFSENVFCKAGNNYVDCSNRYSNYKKYTSRKQKNENQIICNYGEIITARKVRELQILGCLIVEIFLGKQLRTFNRNSGELSFPDRLKACVTVLRSCNTEIPICINYLTNLLLQPSCTNFSNFKYPTVTDLGLPPPSPHLLLEPLLHCVIPFPKPFFKLYYLLSSLKDFTEVSRELDILYHFVCDGQKCLEYENIERTKILFAQNIGECKVKKCARNLEILMKDLNATTDLEVVCLLLPFVRDLLDDPSTSVLAAWYLFDPVASMLGPKKTTESFLIPLLRLYENELNQFTIPFYTKSAKLYHHSFLLRLIVRFGLKTFLNNFMTALVEGVGGYRDNDKTDFILHTHVQKAFRKCSNLRSMDSEENNDISPDDNPSSSSEKVIDIVTKSPTKEKPAPEPEVFEFENDPDSDQCYQSLIEQLELNIYSELPLNHSTAEEALDASIAENVEQLRSLEELNLNLTDGDSTKEEVQSPTIPIPSQSVANIPCETGSKKSECEYFLDKKSNEVKFDLDSSSSKSFKLDRSKSSDCSQSISSGSFLSEHTKHLSQLRKSEGKISEMSADSIIWLSHRLGPVLTAKYLSRNLLKMLTLCYVGNENLVFVRKDSGTNYMNDGTELISIASSRVIGDGNAAKVLECLSHIAGLYGEQLILLQYLPHMSEMINLCKKRLTPNLEGGLISCLALLQHIIPYLSDSMLMNHLQDFILKGILHPIIRLLGTTKYCFPSSYTARDILARKYLDTLYLLSLRIGVEMTREHLMVPALQRFFMIFDKAAGTVTATEKSEMKNILPKESSPSKSLEESHFIEVRRDGSIMEWAIGGTPIKFSHIDDDKIVESLSPLPTKEDNSSNFNEPLNQALQELRSVFTAELAHTAYIPFLKQVGLSTLTSTLLNHSFIRNLCEEYEQEVKLTYPSINQNMTFLNSNTSDIYKTNASKSSIGSNVALIGNRIDVQNESARSNSVDILSLVSNKMENSTRHLRGNWLAYWEHEIGRSDKDLMFNFKQIRLQCFSGHNNSVKCLHVLDNENSFMSGSRDKTVKLWSLRSQGDGSSVSTCQWTYTAHKKSILAITFLESMRLAASCDSIVHIWDPFMGVNIGYLESSKYPPVNMLRCMPSPSSLLYATTTDGTVRVIDARICSYVHELKVSVTPGGLIRCLAIAPSGNWVATGQSSGQITVLDGRTGLIISSWRAHEGEVLQLIALNESTLISSSLDQVTSVWNPQDGKHKFQMKGNTEPVHCLLHYNNELISGTTANRIGVHTSIDRDACFSSTKLRSDAFKGLLTSMALLPLNRLLLLGADNGNITLLC